uniref:protein-serine/threonine phosphatase n=1 Tax=Oncorhynchus kisutch TaxID=8019 RepID=A0A8C7JWX8_ONCKI
MFHSVSKRPPLSPVIPQLPCLRGSRLGGSTIIDRIVLSFLTVKGAALFLPRGNGSSPTSASRFAQLRSKHAGDLQQHLQTMFTLLRPEDNIKLAVRLESTVYQGTRYMVVVSTNGRQDTEESLVLGMDFSPADSSCSVGLVLPLWSDSLIHLDGDGGFSVSTDNRIHVFKPVSVQAMWSALQSLHKACEVARCHNYFPGSLFLTWVSYYQSRVSSDQSRINEWNAMQDVQSHRADSPVMFSDVPTERERTERLIKTRLREIMMHKDLENVTCKEIRTELEVHMVCNLCEFKEYIDKEMILILGQMDSPTEIFDHVYLGSEWNASNLEELQNSGVQYILNVTREIDNFFPGVFEYHNIRVYDEEATDLLAYWNDTYKFISRARKAGAKCLVHCKMGVSRSASTVIAYAMKEYGWDLERAFNYVKERRAVTKPNPSFMRQLEEYQGILLASKQRHNKLWRSHSDSDLSEHHEPLCKTVQHPHTLGRSDPRNQGNSPAALSLQELLQPLGSPSNTGQVVRSISECGTPSKDHSTPLPQPRAATVVPGISTVTVAETVPVRHETPKAKEPSTTLPKEKCCQLQVTPSVPESSSMTPETSTQTAGLQEPSTPVPDKKLDCDQRLPGASLDSSASQQDPALEAEGSSALSTDHINFFSAREKFQGLTQDGRTRCLSDQALQQTPQPIPRDPGQEQQEDPSVVATGEGEEESMTHTVAPPPGPPSQPEPTASQDHEVGQSNQEVEGKDAESQQEVDVVKEEVKDEAEEMEAVSHSADWAMGSVRRVTQQLEQRMRQDSPSPPPPSLPPTHPHRRSPLFSHSREHSPPASHPFPETNSNPQNAPLGPQGSEVSTVQEKGGGCSPMEEDGGQEAWREGLHEDSVQMHKHNLSDVDFLCLEGVTEFESGTDWDSLPGRGPPGDDDMRETWETLRELGAFLRQVSGGGAKVPRCVGQVWGEGTQARQKRVRGGDRQRAGEVEARIRQAGLTPPSLMKRSASLAKLGCLDLSANDLSNWDISPTSPATPAVELLLPSTEADESSRKLRVLFHNALCPSVSSSRQESLTNRAERPCESRDTPSEHLHSPMSNQGWQKEKHPDSGHALSLTSDLISVATRQQYGRTHPLRRLKKRTVSTLYHTM